MASFHHRQGQYGVDAPYVPLLQAAAGIVCLVLSAFANPGGTALLIWGLILLAMAACFFYTTRRGKFVVWARLIDKLHLKGDERALDLGCGRGLVLLEVARHLSSGEAVGIDLWHAHDQSGNDASATQANARAEGVAERVRLETGDMTALPFADASFDLVVSSLAIHNIPSQAGRIKAIDEAARVMRPGARLLIADFRHTRAYAEHLAKLGLKDVTRHDLGWRFWYGGPLWATHLVSARKA
ncbi:MAG TPA: class I SAM-dependent methyltransferase [Rhodanobacteraceae bacterium]